MNDLAIHESISDTDNCHSEESVQVELFSADKNAQVLVDLQVTAVQQKSSNTLVTESISLSTSPQNQGL